MTFNLFNIVLEPLCQGITVGYWQFGQDIIVCGALLYISRSSYDRVPSWQIDFFYLSFIIFQLKRAWKALREGE
jgi:hypothetical protein